MGNDLPTTFADSALRARQNPIGRPVFHTVPNSGAVFTASPTGTGLDTIQGFFMSTMFAATGSGSLFTALPAELGIVDPFFVVKSYFTQQVQHSNSSPPVHLLESYIKW